MPWQPVLQEAACVGTLTLEGNRKERQNFTFLPEPQQAGEVQSGVQSADASLGCLSGFSQVLAWRGRT